eukprot:480400-Rhodomonas_salina.1
MFATKGNTGTTSKRMRCGTPLGLVYIQRARDPQTSSQPKRTRLSEDVPADALASTRRYPRSTATCSGPLPSPKTKACAFGTWKPLLQRMRSRVG